MIDARNVRTELARIHGLAHNGKPTDEEKAKAGTLFQLLRARVIDDISRTGDSRTRNLMRLLSEFKL